MALPNTSMQDITNDVELSTSKPKIKGNFDKAITNDNYLLTEINSIKSPARSPKSLCVYYSYPNSINGVYDNTKAAAIFAEFDQVVFGSGIEDSSHGAHADTLDIMAKMKALKPSIEIYGYIPMGQLDTDPKLTDDQMKVKADKWKLMGATGIFLDEYGYDYKVTRASQNNVGNYIHSIGMNFIANSWELSYVFSAQNVYLDWINWNGNINNLAPVIGPNDYYLFESMFFYVDPNNNNQYATTQFGIYKAIDYYSTSRVEYGKSYYSQFGTKTMALSTMALNHVNRESYFTICYLASKILNIDAFGMSPESYSARDIAVYSIKPVPEFVESSIHVTNVEHFETVVYSLYSATINGVNLKLIWKPDQADQTNITKGTYKIYWNDAEIRSMQVKPYTVTTFFGSATYDAPSLTAGTQTTTTVTVRGAKIGDFAVASLLVDNQGMQITANVTAIDTVTVILRNGTAGTIDLASTTLNVLVIQKQ